MGQTNNRGFRKHHSIIALLAVSFSALQPTVAADNAIEQEQLATLLRQLDILDRLAEQSANLLPMEHSRYHFDYARLDKDIALVRNGIHDYLTPQRAQPRDPVELTSDYRLESEEAP